MAISIKQKLIVYITLVIILAVVLVTIPAVYFYSDYMVKTHEKQVTIGMDGFNAILENYKTEAANYATIFAQHPGVIRAVEARDGAAIVRILGPLAKDARLDSVTIADEKGIVIARTHDQKTGDSVVNQANVQMALKGTVFTAIEPGTVVKLSVRAGAPVRNEQGRIIGVITPGYNASRDEIVDRVKQMFGVEASLFLGDERVATTIMMDGKRENGTKVNPAVADKVLKQGEKYIGHADILGKEYMTAYLPLLGADKNPLGIVSAGLDIEGLNKGKRQMIFTICLIALCALGIGVIFTFLLARSMTNPIIQLVDVVGKVAAGDLTQNVSVGSKDEIGLMAGSFNNMVGQLRGIVLKVSGLSQTLAASSEQFTASTQQSAEAANQIAVSITEIARGTEKQSDSAAKIHSAAQATSTSTQQISATVTEVATVAQNTSQEAERGRQMVEEAMDQMNQIGQGSEAVQAVITELVKGSQEISEIVNLISSIAGQTNLLALNAAIEAARAGENGRGFAVVAEEVRKLAEESEKAAKQIGALIQRNEVNMGQAVAATEAGSAGVKAGIAAVSSASETFKKIVESIVCLSGRIDDFSGSIEQIIVGNQTLATSIGDIDKISRENAGETQTVSAATEEQSASMQEIASSSQSLAQLARDLQETVAKFKA